MLSWCQFAFFLSRAISDIIYVEQPDILHIFRYFLVYLSQCAATSDPDLFLLRSHKTCHCCYDKISTFRTLLTSFSRLFCISYKLSTIHINMCTKYMLYSLIQVRTKTLMSFTTVQIKGKGDQQKHKMLKDKSIVKTVESTKSVQRKGKRKLNIFFQCINLYFQKILYF